MRRKRATICSEAEVRDSSRVFDTRILEEKNTNLFDMINSALTKTTTRNYFTKKLLALKLKQAQREHCCIDIVNRKSLASSTQNKRASNASNIDELKRQINYLERDELKWDRFPKENQQNQNPSLVSQFNDSQKEGFEMHFVNRLQESIQPMALKMFRNTFKSNFYATSDQQRPLTTDQKRAFKYIAKQRKKSMKKYGGLLGENESQRSIISQTIHSHLTATNTPFRKIMYNCRTKRNQSCTVNIETLEGRQLGKKRAFLIEETNFD